MGTHATLASGFSLLSSALKLSSAECHGVWMPAWMARPRVPHFDAPLARPSSSSDRVGSLLQRRLHVRRSDSLGLTPSRAVKRIQLWGSGIGRTPISSSLRSPPEGVGSKELDFSTWKEKFEEITQAVPIPEGCTSDELHWVDVDDWRLALWRYKPANEGQARAHPVLLLSGISTNAYGFDLDPEVSLARYLRDNGFDVWILEVRGHGLSHPKLEETEETETEKISEDVNSIQNAFVESRNESENEGFSAGETSQKANGASSLEPVDANSKDLSILESPSKEESSQVQVPQTLSSFVDKLSNVLDENRKAQLTDRVKGISNNVTNLVVEAQKYALVERITSLTGKLSNVIEDTQQSAVATQISKLKGRLSSLVENGQNVVSPQVSSLMSKFTTLIEESKKTVSSFRRYDWDFDSYLKEDVPAAMDYIRKVSKPLDGQILAVGHSLGGILLYSHIATSEDGRGGLKGIVTVASAMEYGMSNTSLKLILPLAGPAEALQLPFVPVGLLCRYALPLIVNPPYSLAWIGYQISAANMMDQALFNKLMLINFCTIPLKLLLQMATVFEPGGLKDRTKTLIYGDGLPNCKVPVLGLSADSDLICPQIAVIETLKRLPEKVVFYQHFGGKDGRFYGHYDLLVGKHAKEEVFPAILEFLVDNDQVHGEKIAVKD